MKIIKPLTLGLLHKPYRYQGRNHFVIAALGFFRLGAANERYLTENLQWPQIVKALPPGCPLDEVMPKTRGEVLLAGKAFAPQGKPVTEMNVRLCAAGVDKTLRVIGEREWMYGLVPWRRISDPQPFADMPLTYERAFGGPNHPANLTGCGYTGKPWTAFTAHNHGPMPNIEYPHTPVQSHWKRYAPAGFGPIDMRWAPRKDKHGTFGQLWLKRDAPGLAEDVDWSLFNRAPEDQWLSGHFAGGERYRIEGMHPARPAIEGVLPQTQARAFVLRAGAAPDAAEEVALRLDTVWFFPEQELGVAIYHGQTDIADSDALDIAAVMLAYEHPAAPKPLDHYREVLALRLDPETAALHAFHESQLAPARSAEESARRAARRLRNEAAALAKRQAALDEMTADFWAQSGMQPPPGHVPPKAQPLPLEAIDEQDIADGDFDLSETIQRARALAEDAKKQGEDKLAELRARQAELPPPPPPPDIAAQKAAAFERAGAIAFDLLPPEMQNGATDPQVAECLAALERTEQSGAPLTPAKREEARQALRQIPALRRKGRHAAPEPTAPAQPIAPEVARWIGEEVRQWVAGGACLAGRDLAGADLRGIDFSGADLREVLLEQADLSGALFAGANLQGAVLTGATFDGADFSGADLRHANLCKSKGKAIRFTKANLAHARSIEAAWPQADLSGAVLDDWIALDIDLSGAILDGAHLHRAMLMQAKANGSSWKRADIDKTVLIKAALERADFSGAALNKAVLMDAVLHASVWRAARLAGIYGGGKADWSEAVLTAAVADGCGWHGASFARADLRDGHFLRCDFGRCDFDGANLENGLFSRSLFMQTALRSVRAQRADFFQALCRKADFSGADLRQANLVQVEFTGALFDGARLDEIRLDKQRRVA